MDKQTITFRADVNKIAALDAVAEAQERDRSYVLNEALTNYLEIKQWQLAQIEEGIRQAKANQGIDHDVLMARLRQRSK